MLYDVSFSFMQEEEDERGSDDREEPLDNATLVCISSSRLTSPFVHDLGKCLIIYQISKVSFDDNKERLQFS